MAKGQLAQFWNKQKKDVSKYISLIVMFIDVCRMGASSWLSPVYESEYA